MMNEREAVIYSLDIVFRLLITPLSANPTKWSNILQQFVGNN